MRTYSSGKHWFLLCRCSCTEWVTFLNYIQLYFRKWFTYAMQSSLVFSEVLVDCYSLSFIQKKAFKNMISEQTVSLVQEYWRLCPFLIVIALFFLKSGKLLEFHSYIYIYFNTTQPDKILSHICFWSVLYSFSRFLTVWAPVKLL